MEMTGIAAGTAHIVRSAAGSSEIAFELLPPSDHALLVIVHDPFDKVVHIQQRLAVLEKIAVCTVAVT